MYTGLETFLVSRNVSRKKHLKNVAGKINMHKHRIYVNEEITYSHTGKGNSNPLQHSCLENSMEGGAGGAVVHRVAKSVND